MCVCVCVCVCREQIGHSWKSCWVIFVSSDVNWMRVGDCLRTWNRAEPLGLPWKLHSREQYVLRRLHREVVLREEKEENTPEVLIYHLFMNTVSVYIHI